MLVHQLLANSAESAANKEAIVDGERRFSYAEMFESAEHLANNLTFAGIERRDRVAIWLDKSAEEACAFFGISMAGGVTVPINSLLVANQVAHILNDCGVRYLITDASRAIENQELLAGLNDLDAVLIIEPEADLSLNCVRAAMTASASQSLLGDRQIGEDLAAILYTSGSTGKPKGVMLSHSNILAGSRIVCHYLSITSEERILSVLPFSFDAGLNQLFTSVEKAATIVLLRFRFGGEIVKAIEAEKCTALAGVPTIWAVLTGSAPSFRKNQLASLRYFTNTGGPVPSATLAKVRAAQPHVDFFLMYGLTEAFRSTYLPPAEIDKRPTSMGIAIPETEIFLVAEDGSRCGPGEEGILVHRGPTVSLGYWNRPEDTAKVLRQHPFIAADEGGDTVCFSGDRVRQDEDGYFYFVGRADAMIKSSGYRISPTEVEEVLVASGRVAEAAVIGLPDPSIGERVHAICVGGSGKSEDADALLEHCAAELPRHMLPRQIEWVAELPRSPNGKVDYKRLKSERVQ